MWDWDDAKRRANLARHGVDFVVVEHFDWERAMIEPDLRYDYGEPRMAATGIIGGRLHVMIYTERDGEMRLISLRKANRRECEKWERFAK